MSLEKVTPTHRAIAVLDTTIKTLKLQRDALAATLPEQKKQPPMTEMVHPITGRVFKVRKKMTTEALRRPDVSKERFQSI